MNRVLEDIQPKNVFRFFEDICNIPHGSGNVEKISRYLVDFAKERGLDYRQDENFNVVIRKTIQELYEYLQEYEGPTDRFSELVQKNVIDWLFGHIKTYDRSVAKFIFMKQNPDRC